MVKLPIARQMTNNITSHLHIGILRRFRFHRNIGKSFASFTWRRLPAWSSFQHHAFSTCAFRHGFILHCTRHAQNELCHFFTHAISPGAIGKAARGLRTLCLRPYIGRTLALHALATMACVGVVGPQDFKPPSACCSPQPMRQHAVPAFHRVAPAGPLRVHPQPWHIASGAGGGVHGAENSTARKEQ